MTGKVVELVGINLGDLLLRNLPSEYEETRSGLRLSRSLASLALRLPAFKAEGEEGDEDEDDVLILLISSLMTSLSTDSNTSFSYRSCLEDAFLSMEPAADS